MGMIIYSCITPTAQSREHDTIGMLKLVLLWLLFSVYKWFLSDCHLFQAPLTSNKLYKQMHSLVNLLIKLSMLHGASGLAPPGNLFTPSGVSRRPG